MPITYAVINESTAPEAAAEIGAMLPALRDQWNDDLAPVWGLEPVFLLPVKREDSKSDYRWLVFLDDSDQAEALAYHDLTATGMPICKVFVKTVAAAGEPLSIAASHEMVESAVNPWLNVAYQDQDGAFWAGEVADPVEDKQFAYAGTNGVRVSDWVTPNWFGHQHNAGPLDFKGHLSEPFQIISGGYAQRFDLRYGWQQLFSQDTTGFRRTLIRGSRRERLVRGARNWRRSATSA